MTLKDIAMLVVLLKQYRNEIVRYAYDALEMDGNDDIDIKEIADNVKHLDEAIEVVKDDFDYRLNNF